MVGETGLTATFATTLRTVGPKGWVDLHLAALRPVLEALASTLGEAMQAEEGDDDDPAGQRTVAGLPRRHTAQRQHAGAPRAGTPGRAGGLDDRVPVRSTRSVATTCRCPRARHPPTASFGGDEPSLTFVVPNIDAFEESWSLPREDLRFYVALHEVVHAAVRSVPWVRGLLVRLSIEYVSSYEIDAGVFESEFGDVDPSDPESLQRMAADPQRILGAMQSDRQQAPREALQRLTSVIDGYADFVLETIGRRLITTFDQIHEAMKRHRVERGEAERFIEGLLGLKLERAHYERGEAFCRGVVERAGADGLNRLWEREAMLPTPAELDAPGLWLARIELPD